MVPSDAGPGVGSERSRHGHCHRPSATWSFGCCCRGARSARSDWPVVANWRPRR